MMAELNVFHSMLVITFISLAWNCSSSTNPKSETWDSTVFSPSDTTYHIITSIDNTYGYEILVGGNVLIRQQNIPGLPGVKGFIQKGDAEKVAQLVLNKLAKGIVPPSVEKQEMDELNIKY